MNLRLLDTLGAEVVIFGVSMKKIFASVLVVALLMPVLGLLCYCCPEAAAAESSSTSVIVSRDCSCCVTTELKRDQGLLGRFESLVPGLVWNLFSRISSIDKNSTALQSIDKSLSATAFGPPDFSPHTPLYLSLEILRL